VAYYNHRHRKGCTELGFVKGETITHVPIYSYPSSTVYCISLPFFYCILYIPTFPLFFPTCFYIFSYLLKYILSCPMLVPTYWTCSLRLNSNYVPLCILGLRIIPFLVSHLCTNFLLLLRLQREENWRAPRSSYSGLDRCGSSRTQQQPRSVSIHGCPPYHSSSINRVMTPLFYPYVCM
jgi:hypothetical protein